MDKVFKCEDCQYFTKRLVDLKRHSKSCLRQEHLFVCDVCGKMFKRKKHYNVHMKTHQSEKSFKCNICGNKFSTACNLNKHYRTIHLHKKVTSSSGTMHGVFEDMEPKVLIVASENMRKHMVLE